MKGLTFLIRAKNEEKNVELCLKSLLTVTNGLDNIFIVFVDNGSTDKTYEIAQSISSGDRNNISLYKFDQPICKIGNNISGDGQKNQGGGCTIATYYNWCLNKAQTHNVIKWDADFIAHPSLRDIIIEYKLNERDDNFALWFSGITLFENNRNEWFEKIDSYYDEFRVYSKKHGFRWIDMNMCEHPTPASNFLQLRTNKRLFYEVKRTSIDEFAGRVANIDMRDVIDRYILNTINSDSNPLYQGKELVRPFDFRCIKN